MARALESNTLRRIALGQQGLLQKEPFGRGKRGVLAAIRHLSYLQLDTISVVTRAHNHVLFNRVPGFAAGQENALLKERKIFEYRFPIAAFRPIEHFRFMLPYRDRYGHRPHTNEVQALFEPILRRIEEEGPLRSRDFETPPGSRGAWWDHKPAKRALEYLFHRGELMIGARDGFEKYYDLTERVLPAEVDQSEPRVEEIAHHLVESTLRAHGFGTYRNFSADVRGIPVTKPLKAELEERTGTGELVAFENNSGQKLWARAETLDTRPPRVPKRVRILSPFDNTINKRDRALDVFNFDFTIECFVPEPKRRFGYFCLPILYGDEFVGRMDCKAHREASHFEVKALFLEPDWRKKKQIDELAKPLAKALHEFAAFDDCADVSITRTTPTTARSTLRKAL